MAISANLALICKDIPAQTAELVSEEKDPDVEIKSQEHDTGSLACPKRARGNGGLAEEDVDVREQVSLLRMEISGIETAMAVWKGKLSAGPCCRFCFEQDETFGTSMTAP